MDQQPRSGNRRVWDLLVVLGVLLVGTAAGFWLSEQRNAARYQEVQNALVKLEQELRGSSVLRAPQSCRHTSNR